VLYNISSHSCPHHPEAIDVRRNFSRAHCERLRVFDCLAAQINDPTVVSYRPIEWMLNPAPWHRGRVVLIGDAAHANPPNVAQGAAMGIEHAVVLAEEATAPGAFEDAMTRFMARRWERVKLVVEVSRSVAKNQPWSREVKRNASAPAEL